MSSSLAHSWRTAGTVKDKEGWQLHPSEIHKVYEVCFFNPDYLAMEDITFFVFSKYILGFQLIYLLKNFSESANFYKKPSNYEIFKNY
jgi:hypothetical protein